MDIRTRKISNRLILSGLVLGCIAELDNIVKDKIHSLLVQIGPEQTEKLMNDCTRLYYNSYGGNSDKLKEFLGQSLYHKALQKSSSIWFSATC